MAMHNASEPVDRWASSPPASASAPAPASTVASRSRSVSTTRGISPTADAGAALQTPSRTKTSHKVDGKVGRDEGDVVVIPDSAPSSAAARFHSFSSTEADQLADGSLHIDGIKREEPSFPTVPRQNTVSATSTEQGGLASGTGRNAQRSASGDRLNADQNETKLADDTRDIEDETMMSDLEYNSDLTMSDLSDTDWRERHWSPTIGGLRNTLDESEVNRIDFPDSTRDHRHREHRGTSAVIVESGYGSASRKDKGKAKEVDITVGTSPRKRLNKPKVSSLSPLDGFESSRRDRQLAAAAAEVTSASARRTKVSGKPSSSSTGVSKTASARKSSRPTSTGTDNDDDVQVYQSRSSSKRKAAWTTAEGDDGSTERQTSLFHVARLDHGDSSGVEVSATSATPSRRRLRRSARAANTSVPPRNTSGMSANETGPVRASGRGRAVVESSKKPTSAPIAISRSSTSSEVGSKTSSEGVSHGRNLRRSGRHRHASLQDLPSPATPVSQDSRRSSFADGFDDHDEDMVTEELSLPTTSKRKEKFVPLSTSLDGPKLSAADIIARMQAKQAAALGLEEEEDEEAKADLDPSHSPHRATSKLEDDQKDYPVDVLRDDDLDGPMLLGASRRAMSDSSDEDDDLADAADLVAKAIKFKPPTPPPPQKKPIVLTAPTTLRPQDRGKFSLHNMLKQKAAAERRGWFGVEQAEREFLEAANSDEDNDGRPQKDVDGKNEEKEDSFEDLYGDSSEDDGGHAAKSQSGSPKKRDRVSRQDSAGAMERVAGALKGKKGVLESVKLANEDLAKVQDEHGDTLDDPVGSLSRFWDPRRPLVIAVGCGTTALPICD